MRGAGSLPFRSALEEYRREAEALLRALEAGEESALWRFKWMHPRFSGRPVAEVRSTSLDLGETQQVVAREHAFEDWEALTAFTQEVQSDGSIHAFEAAADAVVSGDIAALRSMLRENLGLARQRSTRRHRASLLHYLAANGVEQGRQTTPRNAVVDSTLGGRSDRRIAGERSAPIRPFPPFEIEPRLRAPLSMLQPARP